MGVWLGVGGACSLAPAERLDSFLCLFLLNFDVFGTVGIPKYRDLRGVKREEGRGREVCSILLCFCFVLFCLVGCFVLFVCFCLFLCQRTAGSPLSRRIV